MTQHERQSSIVDLIEKINAILCLGYGVDRVEDYFVEVSNELSETSLRQFFMELVVKAIDSRFDPIQTGLPPRELIEFVAHERRWPEFEQLARCRNRNHVRW